MKATINQLDTIERLSKIRWPNEWFEELVDFAKRREVTVVEMKTMDSNVANWLISELELRAEGDESRKQRDAHQ